MAMRDFSIDNKTTAEGGQAKASARERERDTGLHLERQEQFKRLKRGS